MERNTISRKWTGWRLEKTKSLIVHIYRFWWAFLSSIPQVAKFMWPTWGPPGSCRPKVGPMLAPWTLLSGTCTWSEVRAWMLCNYIPQLSVTSNYSFIPYNQCHLNCHWDLSMVKNELAKEKYKGLASNCQSVLTPICLSACRQTNVSEHKILEYKHTKSLR